MIEKLRELAVKYDVEKIANVVLNDERLPIWSGSSNPLVHHYGKGGLLTHITEVVELCLLNNSYLNVAKDSHLYLAALFHDVGKFWDYEPITGPGTRQHIFGYKDYQKWRATEHKHKIHHISRSVLVWNEATVDIKDEWKDEITHAILSHHGLKEWGSPVQPHTQLAWLLHLCDGISARCNDCSKQFCELMEPNE